MNRLLGIIAILFLAVPIIPNHTAFAFDVAENIQVRVVGESGVNLSWQLESASSSTFLSNFNAEQSNQLTDDLEIPSVTRWVAVPPGHRVELRVNNNHSVQYNLTQDGSINSQVAGELVQAGNLQLNPPAVAVAGQMSTLRGIQVVPVTIYPVQVGIDGLTTIENRNVNVSVEFVPDENANQDLRVFNDHPNSSTARMIDQLLVNPPRRDPGEPQVEYFDHILILHQDDDNFMNRSMRWVDSLATWKRQMGYKVSLLAVDTRTDAITIRNMIREYWDVEAPEIPINHVIIIGGDIQNQYLYFPNCPYEDGIYGDHLYTILRELGDVEKPIVSDVTIGRFQAHSNEELAGEIMRSIWYERSPLREDENDNWFSKAIVAAERANFVGGQFVPSMVHLGRWIYSRLIQTGFTEVDTLWPDARVPTRRALEAGRSLAFSRGHLDGCLDADDPDVGIPYETDRRNPLVMTITCLSFKKLDKFWRTGVNYNPNRLDQLSGAVAGMGIIELTNTKVNTSLSSGIFRGMRYFGLNQPGLLQNFGKIQLSSDYTYDPEVQLGIVKTLAFFRLVGDPTVNCWTGTPIDLTVDHPERITSGQSGLNIEVTNEGNGVPNATVCISQQDGVHLVTYPGDDGVARFSFDSGELEDGELVLTITGQNMFPYITTIEVSGSGIDMETVDYNFDETTLFGEAIDNQDELFGNGYSIPTSLSLLNSSQADFDDISVSLSSEDELISFEPAQIDVGQMNANSQSQVEFDLAFDRSSHGGRDVLVNVEILSGDQAWSHSFYVKTSGCILAIQEDQLIGDDFDRGSEPLYEATIVNNGDIATPRFSATLVSLDPETIVVTRERATYPSIGVGASEEPTGGRIEFQLDEYAIPGNTYDFMILIASLVQGDSLRDTLYFSKTITNHNDNDPFGPDEYGYLCFDSNDGRDWSKAPNYQWREINPRKPNSAFDGERLTVEVVGATRDPDTSAVVALPFTFQYYGQEFDTIVVCANGWFAFGAEQSMFVDFRNWQIPGNQGPDAQVCAFWQDLVNVESSDRGLFVHHVEEEGIFIIEWSEWSIAGPDPDLLEFQVILYDENNWPTESHDGDIKIQYKNVVMVRGEGFDNDYATVGIKNLDNTDGLEYTWWNHRPTGASEIENELAILFTTETELRVGAIEGTVVTLENNSAVEGATVLAMPAGLFSVTDVDGNFRIDDIPVGTSVVEVRLHGYNIFRQSGVAIVEDELSTLNVQLTHPEMQVARDPILMGDLPLWETRADTLTFANSGSGPLIFNLSTRYSNGDPIVHDQLNSTIPITEIVNDNWIRGCELIWGNLYITGSNFQGTIEDQDTSLVNYIYVLNSDNQLIDRIVQPSRTPYGFAGLAWDSKNDILYGSEVIAGNFGGTFRLVAFDRQGQFLRSFGRDTVAEYGYPRALVINPDSSSLFYSSEAFGIFEMKVLGDRAGEIIPHSFSLPGETLDITGMAWNSLDKETPLYIMDTNGDDSRMRIIRYNPWTRMMRIVGEIPQDILIPGEGLTFGYDWNQGTHTMMTVGGYMNDEFYDQFSVYEYDFGPDSRFISYDPGPYGVPSNSELNVELLFDAISLRESLVGGIYRAGLYIEHNSAEGPVTIPLQMTVAEPKSVDEDDKIIPSEFNLEQAYPNPFNSSTRIGFTLPNAGVATLTIFDISGREVVQLVDREYSAGRYEVLFDAVQLSSGVYFYKLESNGLSSARRMVLLK